MNMSAGAYLVRQRFEDEMVVPWKIPNVDIHLQYWEHDNLITDEHGDVVYDIFSMITPNDLAMFKADPYWNIYFLHVDDSNKVIAISYKDPYHYEQEDYRRFPTLRDQIYLRECEMLHECDSPESNFKLRRELWPDLYE